jgi:hypothetical protein
VTFRSARVQAAVIQGLGAVAGQTFSKTGSLPELPFLMGRRAWVDGWFQRHKPKMVCDARLSSAR